MVCSKGVAFFNIETLLSLLFYFLIGERITGKEGLETFIKKDYKVYTVRHYITSGPFLSYSGLYKLSSNYMHSSWVFEICQTSNMFLRGIKIVQVYSTH